MKKLIKYLIITVVLYLLFSFVTWQFDPTIWSIDVRGTFAVMWGVCMVLTPIINGMIEQMKD
jgi:hypothetical protein